MQINWTRLLSNTNTVYMWNFYELKSHKVQIAEVLTTIICLEMTSKGAKDQNLLLQVNKNIYFFWWRKLNLSNFCLGINKVTLDEGERKDDHAQQKLRLLLHGPRNQVLDLHPKCERGDTAFIRMVAGTGRGVPFLFLSPRGHMSLREHSLVSQEDKFYTLMYLFNLCVLCVFWVARMCGNGRGRRQCRNL